MRPQLILTGIMSLALVCFGAGCSSTTNAPSSSEAASKADSQQVTQDLVFSPGDTFVLSQTFYGVGQLPSLLWPAKDLDRTVTVDVFAPKVQATISWVTETEQETENSLKERTEYEKMIAARKKGDIYPPPPTVYTEIVTAKGSVNAIDLLDSQTLALPAYWTPGILELGNLRSGIWLSQNAYQELTRTKSTNVYFDITSQAASELLTSSQTWVKAVKQLHTQEVAASQKQDVTRMKLQGELMDWPLMVNGVQKNVKVWKASSAFGELIILANEQNPLILKATVNPALPGITSAVQGETDWNKLFGYEIKSVTIAHNASST